MPHEEQRRQPYQETARPKKTHKIKQRSVERDRVRRHDWLLYVPDDDESEMMELPAGRRVESRGKRDRRHPPVEVLAALEEEETEDYEDLVPPPPPTEQGIVVEVSNGLCRVGLSGRDLVCKVETLSPAGTGFSNVIAVGDEVTVTLNGEAGGTVEEVLPRRTVLARSNGLPGRAELMVANADQLLIVMAWREPDICYEVLDRYLVVATRYKLTPVICISKVDLAEGEAALRTAFEAYQELKWRVIFTSTFTGEGMNELRQVLRRQTTIITGPAGVGKSALLATIQPGLGIQAAELSQASSPGAVTTRLLLQRLDIGGFVIDMPDLAEFGLNGLRQKDLASYYPEMAAQAGRCRFSDCSHTHEPGCLIKAAVQQGRISGRRHRNYKKIYYTLPA